MTDYNAVRYELSVHLDKVIMGLVHAFAVAKRFDNEACAYWIFRKGHNTIDGIWIDPTPLLPELDAPGDSPEAVDLTLHVTETDMEFIHSLATHNRLPIETCARWIFLKGLSAIVGEHSGVSRLLRYQQILLIHMKIANDYGRDNNPIRSAHLIQALTAAGVDLRDD